MDQLFVESSGWYAAVALWLAPVATYLWFSARAQRR
jgi:hypothetical protein